MLSYVYSILDSHDVLIPALIYRASQPTPVTVGAIAVPKDRPQTTAPPPYGRGNCGLRGPSPPTPCYGKASFIPITAPTSASSSHRKNGRKAMDGRATPSAQQLHL